MVQQYCVVRISLNTYDMIYSELNAYYCMMFSSKLKLELSGYLVVMQTYLYYFPLSLYRIQLKYSEWQLCRPRVCPEEQWQFQTMKTGQHQMSLRCTTRPPDATGLTHTHNDQIKPISIAWQICRSWRIGGAWWWRLVKSVQCMRCRTVPSLACFIRMSWAEWQPNDTASSRLRSTNVERSRWQCLHHARYWS